MRDKRLTWIRWSAAFVALVFTAGCQLLGPRTDRRTLERKVMVGYQGWFRTPGDGAAMGWAHYQEQHTTDFRPGHVSIDYWPDVSELSAAERFTTPFATPAGRPAEVFSSHQPRTVDRHFAWMQTHGIDGAFVQRFAAPIVFEDKTSLQRRRATDDVLGYALAAAAHHGRSVAVMYDLSGLSAGAMPRVIADWKRLNEAQRPRASSAYQFHRGKPVVAVWGIGFADDRAYTIAECATLVDFLQHDPVYGGNVVMLGVPTWWREQTVDAVKDSALLDLLARADILSPWTPGRYYDVGGVAVHAERFWGPDRAWCAERGIDYMPVVFPGFSWRNLQHTRGGIDRVDGRFLWAQYRALINGGCTMIYQAMFDEMDEGTQIFKVTSTPPPGNNFATYAPLPPDFYLRLVGAAATNLHRGTPLPDRIGGMGNSDAVTTYLAARDDAVERAAIASADTQRRLFEVEDAVSRGGEHAGELRDGARVRAEGRWAAHHRWSDDPAAALDWELPVVESGPHQLSIRYGGDPNEDHAAAARLQVIQDGAVRLEATVNLQEQTLRWHEVGVVRLTAGGPCHVRLANGPVGGLVPFEPRLTAAP
jgi:hypothetical protein